MSFFVTQFRTQLTQPWTSHTFIVYTYIREPHMGCSSWYPADQIIYICAFLYYREFRLYGSAKTDLSPRVDLTRQCFELNNGPKVHAWCAKKSTPNKRNKRHPFGKGFISSKCSPGRLAHKLCTTHPSWKKNKGASNTLRPGKAQVRLASVGYELTF